MPKKQLGDEMIAFALRQAKAGFPVGEMCRKMRNSEATFLRWINICAGTGILAIRRLKQLEDQNGELKPLFADLAQDYSMLQDALKKSG